MSFFLFKIDRNKSSFFKSFFVLFLLQLSFYSVFGQVDKCEIGVKVLSGDYGRYGDRFNSGSGYTQIALCKGSKLSLIAKEGDYKYQWYLNKVAMSDSTSFKITVEQSGEYFVKATNNTTGCIAESIKFELSSYDSLPSSILSFSGIKNDKNENIICGEYGYLQAQIAFCNFIEKPFYQVFKNGVFWHETDNNIYIDNAGSYQVNIKAGKCQSLSNVVNIAKGDENITYGNLLYNKSFIQEKGQIQKLEFFGCETSLVSNISGNKWYKNNDLIANNISYISNVDEGIYKVEIDNYFGCKAKDSVIVNQIKNDRKFKLKLNTVTCDYQLNINKDYEYDNLNKAKIKWYVNSILINNSNYTFFDIDENVKATYKAIVEYENCIIYESENFIFEPEKVKRSNYKMRVQNVYDGTKEFTICPNSNLFVYSNLYGNVPIDLYKDGVIYKTNKIGIYNILSEPGKYYAVSTDFNNCVFYSDTISVNVVTKIPTNIELNTSQCQSKISIPKTEGVKYSWKLNNAVLPNEFGNEIIPKASGKYSLFSSLGDCIYESNEITFKKEEIKKENLKTLFCVGETLTYNAPAANSYSWSGPNDFKSTQQTIQFESLKISDSGLYNLEMKIDGCITKDSIQINVKNKANFEVIVPEYVCEGGSTNLYLTNASALNLGELKVTYNDNGYNYYSNIITLTNIKKGNSNAKILWKSNNTCDTEKTVELKAVTSENCKKINYINPNKGLCYTKDQSIDFTVSGSFSSDEVYYLYSIDYNGKYILLDSTKTNSFFIKANTADKYTYKNLFIESSKEKVQSLAFSTYNGSGYSTLEYSSNKVCDGFSVPLKLKNYGYDFDKIQWKRNGINIENANKLDFSAIESGTYSVEGEFKGCPIVTYYNFAKITIGQINKPFVSDSSIQICNNTTITLNPEYSYDDNTYNYQWLKNGQELLNQKTKKTILSEAGNYQLKVSQGTCSETSNVIKLIVGDQIFAPAIRAYGLDNEKNGELNICDGFDARIYLNSYTNDLAENFKFNWEKDGKEYTNPISNTRYLTTNELGKYRLKVKQGDCVSYSRTVEVKKNNLIKGLKLYAENLQKCENDSIAFYTYDYFEALYNIKYNEKSNFKSTLFKDGKPQKEIEIYKDYYFKESGKYYVIATFKLPESKEICSVSSDTLNIVITGKKVNIKPYYTTYSICRDTLDLQFSYKEKVSSFWKFNDLNLPDKTQSIKATKNGNYQYTETNSAGCVFDYGTVKVELNKIEVSIYKPDSTVAFCKNYNNYLYTSFINYRDKENKTEWFKDAKPLGNNYAINATESGKYKVNLTQGNCTATASVDVKIKEIPTGLTPNVDSLGICVGDIVNIAGPKAQKYSWVQNGNSLPEYTQVLKVKDKGKYSVWLEDEGCGAMSKSIEIKNKMQLPTATITGGGQIAALDSSNIKIDFTSSAPWIFALNNSENLITTENNPYTFKVKPSTDFSYEVKSVKNGCGLGSTSGKAIVSVILADEKLAETDVKIWPNPSNGIVNISAESLNPTKLGFSLISIDGKEIEKQISSKKIVSFEKAIDISNLANGVYILRIFANEKYINYKIIKE